MKQVFSQRRRLWILVLAAMLLLLTGMPAAGAEQADGKVSGLVGDSFYQNGKPVKNKAVRYQGQWYVFDKTGKMVRGRTYRLKKAVYRLREDGTAYVGAWMFGDHFSYFNSNARLNKKKTALLNRYCK